MAVKSKQNAGYPSRPGSKERCGHNGSPRLSVYRSLKHISAQIIDDTTGHTLVAAGTTQADLKGAGNIEGAKKIGEALAKRAIAAGINEVVFDRGGFRYQGRVKSLAEGAREGGLKF